MPSRTIHTKSRTSSMELRRCLSTVLALELMAPTTDLYLFSPWVSDVALLNNAFGQLRAVIPELESTSIRLATILNLLAQRGVHVHILTRQQDNPYAAEFDRKLSSEISLKHNANLHEKGLITQSVFVSGSMNFTHSGVNINAERVTITNNPEEVADALLEARVHWKSILNGEM